MEKNNTFSFCFNGECCCFKRKSEGIFQNINYQWGAQRPFFCDYNCYVSFSNNFCRKYNRKAEFDLSFYEKPEPI